MINPSDTLDLETASTRLYNAVYEGKHEREIQLLVMNVKNITNKIVMDFNGDAQEAFKII